MRRTLIAIVGGSVVVAGCRGHTAVQAEPRAPAPVVSSMPVAVPRENPVAVPSTRAADSVRANEPHVALNYPREVDVRIPLRQIAAAGGFTILVPPSVNKKVAITLDNVPVSFALKAVLDAADLTLEGATSSHTMVPFDTTVVFYQLPANVDSLSVDGIMKRFGVSRDIAELLVRARSKGCC